MFILITIVLLAYQIVTLKQGILFFDSLEAWVNKHREVLERIVKDQEKAPVEDYGYIIDSLREIAPIFTITLIMGLISCGYIIYLIFMKDTVSIAVAIIHISRLVMLMNITDIQTPIQIERHNADTSAFQVIILGYYVYQLLSEHGLNLLAL